MARNLTEGFEIFEMPGDRPGFDLSTYAGRYAAVKAIDPDSHLEEHLCCPRCFDQRAIKCGEKAACEICGWTGEVVQLLDTVQTGATKLP